MRKANSIAKTDDVERFLQSIPVNAAILADAERLGL
jgi:hypothetical protein